jgi:hypothetical protein
MLENFIIKVQSYIHASLVEAGLKIWIMEQEA